MKKILLMVVAALMAISVSAQHDTIKKVRVYSGNDLVYENYYSGIDSIVFVDFVYDSEYSPHYAWGVQGTRDDSNSPIVLLVNALMTGTYVTDAQLESNIAESGVSMTKYMGAIVNPYPGSATLNSLNDGYVVVVSKTKPSLLNEMNGQVTLWRNEGSFTRGTEQYTIYSFPRGGAGTSDNFRNLTIDL